MQHRLSHHALSNSAFAARVIYRANEILPGLLPEAADHVKAYRFERNILFISAQNAVWTQELWGVQNEILEGLQHDFGDRVKKIRIKHLTTH